MSCSPSSSHIGVSSSSSSSPDRSAYCSGISYKTRTTSEELTRLATAHCLHQARLELGRADLHAEGWGRYLHPAAHYHDPSSRGGGCVADSYAAPARVGVCPVRLGPCTTPTVASYCIGFVDRQFGSGRASSGTVESVVYVA